MELASEFGYLCVFSKNEVVLGEARQGLRIQGLKRQGAFQQIGGLYIVLIARRNLCKIAVAGSELVVHLDGFFKCFSSAFDVAHLDEGRAEAVVCNVVAGIKADRLLEMIARFGILLSLQGLASAVEFLFRFAGHL